MHQDDLGNFHAALRAQEINPDLRLVVAIFNTGLGERIRSFFSDCAVLGLGDGRAVVRSGRAGRAGPSHVRVSGRTLYLARRDVVDAGLAFLPLVTAAIVGAHGSAALGWSPPDDHRLIPQDRLFVLATRPGLSRVLTRSWPG